MIYNRENIKVKMPQIVCMLTRDQIDDLIRNVNDAIMRLSDKEGWKRSYSGRQGCCCGCIGNYNTKSAIVDRQRIKMLEMLTTNSNMHVILDVDSEHDDWISIDWVNSNKFSNSDNFDYETGGRTLILYKYHRSDPE